MSVSTFIRIAAIGMIVLFPLSCRTVETTTRCSIAGVRRSTAANQFSVGRDPVPDARKPRPATAKLALIQH